MIPASRGQPISPSYRTPATSGWAAWTTCVIDSAHGTVERLVVRGAGARTVVPWAQVAARRPSRTRGPRRGRSSRSLEATGRRARRWRPPARRASTAQIIDIHGRKVVRVNDIALRGRRRTGCYLRRVDIGLAGAVRRLLAGLVAPRARAPAGRGLPAPRHPLGLRGPGGPTLGHDPAQGPPAARAAAPGRPRRHHRGPRPRRAAGDRLDARHRRPRRRRSPETEPSRCRPRSSSRSSPPARPTCSRRCRRTRPPTSWAT